MTKANCTVPIYILSLTIYVLYPMRNTYATKKNTCKQKENLKLMFEMFF